jgi:hypothetical protein
MTAYMNAEKQQLATLLTRGRNLFLRFDGKSRTGLSTTVTVLVRDEDAQPGRQMANVSLPVSIQLGQRWHSHHDAMIMQGVPRGLQLGPYIAEQLGKALFQDANAFTWEWL